MLYDKFYFKTSFWRFGTCLTFLSYQAGKNKTLLIIQSAGTLSTALSYLFLNTTAGLILNLVCIVRNIVFYFIKRNSNATLFFGLFFAVIMTILGVYSWGSWASLLIIVALAANTIFLSFGKPQLLRKSILFTSTIVIVYNILVFSIGGIVNESVAIISSFIGIVRFRKDDNVTK